MSVKFPNLEDLHLLVTIATTGSIGQAAAELGVTQPSASRRVAVLERSLRVTLLRRGTRGSTLTRTGRVVVDWAIELLRAADEFSHSVESLGREHNSLLHAAASMTIAEHYAPTWLAKVRHESASTVVSLSVANSAEVMEMVESGKVDLGLIESPSVRPTLRSRQIGKDDLAIAVCPDHAWADGRPVSPAELASAALLVREPGSGTRETLDRALAAAGYQFTPALELASNTALKSAAIAGMGPVVLSAIALAHDFDSRTLVEVNLQGMELSRPLTIVWIDSTSLSHDAVTLFLKAAGGDRRTRGRRPRMCATAPEHKPSPGDATTVQVPADPPGPS